MCASVAGVSTQNGLFSNDQACRFGQQMFEFLHFVGLGIKSCVDSRKMNVYANCANSEFLISHVSLSQHLLMMVLRMRTSEMKWG